MGEVRVVLTASVVVGEDNVFEVLVVSLVDNSVADASVVGEVRVVLSFVVVNDSVCVGDGKTTVVCVVSVGDVEESVNGEVFVVLIFVVVDVVVDDIGVGEDKISVVCVVTSVGNSVVPPLFPLFPPLFPLPLLPPPPFPLFFLVLGRTVVVSNVGNPVLAVNVSIVEVGSSNPGSIPPISVV